jgi:hypothetical protein
VEAFAGEVCPKGLGMGPCAPGVSFLARIMSRSELALVAARSEAARAEAQSAWPRVVGGLRVGSPVPKEWLSNAVLELRDWQLSGDGTAVAEARYRDGSRHVLVVIPDRQDSVCLLTLAEARNERAFVGCAQPPGPSKRPPGPSKRMSLMFVGDESGGVVAVGWAPAGTQKVRLQAGGVTLVEFATTGPDALGFKFYLADGLRHFHSPLASPPVAIALDAAGRELARMD